MKISDITQLSKDDILGALGLESRRSTGSAFAESLAVFSVGMLLGASIALVLAPKSGRELREDLNHRLRKNARDAADQAELMKS